VDFPLGTASLGAYSRFDFLAFGSAGNPARILVSLRSLVNRFGGTPSGFALTFQARTKACSRPGSFGAKFCNSMELGVSRRVRARARGMIHQCLSG
jgi:hypothetical protein